jgi:hypothetical protein
MASSKPALDKVLALDNSIQSRQRYISTVRGLGGEIDALAMLGTLQEWWVLGPFYVGNLAENWEKGFIDPKAVNLKDTFTEDDTTRAWQRTDAEGEIGLVSLHTLFGMVDNSFGYAYCEVELAERTVVQLRLGSDDGVVAWVNGAKIHNHLVDRGSAPDQDVVLTRLEAGRNRILLRISQGSGGWGFCSRLTTKDGAALDFQHVTPESAQ